MRKGIVAAGNWVFDHVKILDVLPEKGMLGSILDEDIGGGGSAYNVLVDLAKMKVDFPLYGAGLLGNDHKGTYIMSELHKHAIDTKNLEVTTNAPTSYTDVMTEKDSGNRTFFHCRGANAMFDIIHIEKIINNAKIFHLGYLLLLDKLDQPDAQYGVVSARALDMLQKKGYKTSVDVVSESGDRFQRLVTPTLPYINYLILNEIEAERISGYTIREGEKINSENLKKATHWLMEKGVKDMVVIHFPEGGYAKEKSGNEMFVPSFLVQNNEIVGSVGAGDAFCAGMLYAIHEEIDLKEALLIANANARFNLLDATSTGGAVAIAQLKSFIQTATLRESII